MKFFHDEATVLKKHRVGEKDELILLFTKHHGRLAVMSKGSRDPKSKKAGVLELFNTLSFQARESKAGIPYLQQVKLIRGRGFEIVQESEELFYRASHLIQLTLDHVHEGQILPQLYSDLNAALDVVSCSFVDVAFRVRLLADLGFLPDWSRCSVTHQKLDLNEPIVFSSENKGFSSRQVYRGGIRVQSDLVKLLSFFQTRSIDHAVQVEVGPHLEQGIRSIVDQLDVH